MLKTDIFELSARAEKAQLIVQSRHQNLDPVIGVNRSMRKRGFPVDLITIDCLLTQRRVTMMLDDTKVGRVFYRFETVDADQHIAFSELEFARVTSDRIANWIIGVFTQVSE